MLSLKLLTVLVSTPATMAFRKLLRIDYREQKRPFWHMILYLVLIFMLMMGVTTPPAYFILINLLALRKALQISETIAHQHAAGRYEVLAAAPMGDAGFVLRVAQACHNSPSYWLPFLGITWMIFTLLLFVLLLFREIDIVKIVLALGVLSAIALVLFIDYVQCTVWAVVLGILAGLTREPTKARIVALTGYLGVHTLIYGAMIAAVIVALLRLWANITDQDAVVFLFTALMVSFVVREGLISMMWVWIRQHLNDDLPALMSVARS